MLSLINKMWEMTDFDDRLSQRSKVVLRRHFLAWYLQCYLDPEAVIYFEQRFFIDELISLIEKKREILSSKEKSY